MKPTDIIQTRRGRRLTAIGRWLSDSLLNISRRFPFIRFDNRRERNVEGNLIHLLLTNRFFGSFFPFVKNARRIFERSQIWLIVKRKDLNDESELLDAFYDIKTPTIKLERVDNTHALAHTWGRCRKSYRTSMLEVKERSTLLKESSLIVSCFFDLFSVPQGRPRRDSAESQIESKDKRKRQWITTCMYRTSMPQENTGKWLATANWCNWTTWRKRLCSIFLAYKYNPVRL